MKKLEIYKKDVLSYFCLIFCFLFFSKFFSNYINFIIDVGREFIYPQYMNEGYLLYRDLFNLFGPLGYQINAFVFSLFGAKYQTLHTLGMINTFVVITLLYIISRQFLNEIFSFLNCFIILFTCIFVSSCSNFVLPYSYSLVYSYSFMLIALLSFLYAIKYKNKLFSNLLIYLTFFACGVSLASKYEYAVFTLAVIAFYFILFKPKFKNILISLVCLGAVPLVSYSICLIQGVSVDDFIQTIKYINVHTKSKTLTYFYTHFTGTYFSLNYFKSGELLRTIITYGCLILLSIAYIIAKLKFNKKYIYEFIFTLLGFYIFIKTNVNNLFIYAPYFIVLIVIYLVYEKFKNKADVTLILVFSILALCTSVKTLFYINFDVYGGYTLPLLLICFSSFLVNEVIKKVPFIPKDIMFNTYTLILCLVCIVIYVYTYADFVNSYTRLKIDNKFYGFETNQKSVLIMSMVDYMNKNVGKDETMIVLPTGSMFNFVTGRKMPLPSYYTLIPTHVDTFGQDKIVEDFKKAKIDYIFILIYKSNEYNCDVFGENKNEYKIKQYINENYDDLGVSYGCKIYKIKKDKKFS